MAVMEADSVAEARVAAASAATEAENWPAAAALWDALRRDFPDDVVYWRNAGQAYREAAMLHQADRLLSDAVARFPDDLWTGYHFLLVARRRADWMEALRRAETLRGMAPNFWPAWTESADALERLGLHADADQRRREAAERFPDQFWPNFGLATVEARRAEPAASVQIWLDMDRRFPDCPEVQKALDAAKAVADNSPFKGAGDRSGIVKSIGNAEYRCPTDLQLTETRLKRVMVIGSCLSGGMPEILKQIRPDCEADHFLVNNAAILPAEPPAAPEAYDFHVVQIPLRQILPERLHFGLSYADKKAYQELFETARGALADALAETMRWNREHGILTFVCNFLVPQQNPMGRLLPRYDLRNFQFFIEKLNEALEEELQAYKNAYLFDLDQIVGTFGRRHFQDDIFWILSHGAALTDSGWEEDQARLEPLQSVTRYYPTAIVEFVIHMWNELIAMYRTVRQTDMVKLVLVDLDDTMWRGVAAEASDVSSMAREGWPLGFAEALMFLKRRGVLLGIVSKNDEGRVREIWQRIYGDLIRFDDFAVRKINWQPKADNIEQILEEVNLLPKSVVFIDDNPVERAAIKAAFPDMRVLGPNPYLWRRILLWAPETQVATVTAESAARTEMVQKQVEREQSRKKLSRAEFLASLQVRAALHEVTSTADARFPRSIELINKTNQFNTTGQRWTLQEFERFFRDGGRLFALDVTDRYTAYGIVGVLLVSGAEIVQFVMSCRVVGMDVEIAAVAGVLGAIEPGECRTSLVETSANLLCRDLWQRCGFVALGEGRFHRDPEPALAVPAHIELQVAAAGQPAGKRRAIPPIVAVPMSELAPAAD